eukprot:g4771.t1
MLHVSTFFSASMGMLLGLLFRNRAHARRFAHAPGISTDGALRKYAAPQPISPAAVAAAKGDTGALRGMPEAALREVGTDGNTALIWAADGGHAETLRFLLQPRRAAADVNRRGYLGNTALARACRQGHLEAVRALLATPGCDPNVCNDKLQYPLHFAAFQRHAGVVRAMLESGLCDTLVLDRKGRTPAEDTKDAGIRSMIIASRA